MFYQEQCRWFSGYKPCHFKRSCEGCPEVDLVSSRLAIVSLEAMGAVLRSTCLLQPLRRKFPQAHITWITLPQCKPLLEANPLIDRVLSVQPASLALLQFLEFDHLYAVDKSLEAGALAETIRAKHKWGFGLTPTGSIRPFTAEASYQYDLGLDDELKFFRNQKSETQQITESMGLVWQRDPYTLELTQEEKNLVAQHRSQLLTAAGGGRQSSGVIGYNTGCSLLFPYKKFTLTRACETITQWRQDFPDYTVALLGGPEDHERQHAMKAAFADDPLVVNTPTGQGLRSGIRWMAASDMVFTGCSLGMHIAIALKKQVLAWFGVSCIQEIDLYDRGIKLQAGVSCSPCWKKSCSNEPKCYDQVSLRQISEATQQLLAAAKPDAGAKILKTARPLTPALESPSR